MEKEKPIELEVRQKFALPRIKAGRVLDVGCSDGSLLLKLKSMGMETVGIEIDPNLARKCVEKGLNVLDGDVEKMDTAALGAFDSIVMTDVIEHFTDPLSVLKKLSANLKPDGVFVLTTPNVDWLFWHLAYAILRPFGWKPHAWINPEHKQFYNKRTLAKLLDDAGYRIVGDNSIGKIPKTGIHFKSPTGILSCNIVVAARKK